MKNCYNKNCKQANPQISDSQKHSCAICGKNKDKLNKALAVDHCHKTGKIRGLLCNKCNLMIGYGNDDPELMLSASRYLKQ